MLLLLRALSLATPCPPRYRAAELKHGRVAMLATCGIAYTASGGPLFAGPVALDGTTFQSLGSDPWQAFAALPYMGKLQMLVVIGLLEFHSEIPSGGQAPSPQPRPQPHRPPVRLRRSTT